MQKEVLVHEFDSEVEAQLAKAKLESFDIKCIIQKMGLHAVGVPVSTGGVNIYVLEKDVEKAKEILLDKWITMLKPGIYQHYKGDMVEVIGKALHSETLEEFVAYRHITGIHSGEEHYWVRPLKMFMEEVKVNGETRPRFTWVRENQ